MFLGSSADRSECIAYSDQQRQTNRVYMLTYVYSLTLRHRVYNLLSLLRGLQKSPYRQCFEEYDDIAVLS
jgi:hypothetical protein